MEESRTNVLEESSSFLGFSLKLKPMSWMAIVFVGLGLFLALSLLAMFFLTQASGMSGDLSGGVTQMVDSLGFPVVFSGIMSVHVILCLIVYVVWVKGLKFPGRALFRVGASFKWKWWFGSFLVVFLLSGLMDWFYLSRNPVHVWTFDADRFWAFLPVALIFFPFQTLFEEFLYRGFLMRWSFSLTKSGLVALVLSASFFSLMHMGNKEVEAYGTGSMFFYYAWQGGMLALLVMLSNGLEAAWGYHLANNLYGSLIISVPDASLPVPSLWQSTPPEGSVFLFYSALSTLIIVLSLVLMFRWRDWNRLFPEKQLFAKDKE